MSTVVAIHQPNFYPWLGFFDKWLRADVFVLLDDVQFPKTGGVWTNRCGILRNGQRAWFTASVDRTRSGLQSIQEVELAREVSCREKLMRTFEHSYARAPHVDRVRGLLAEDLLGTQSRLIELNMSALCRLGVQMGLDEGKLILSSGLGVTAMATERLAAIVERVNGDVYLCGGGAEGYQRDELFADRGIGLEYQRFETPTYKQWGSDYFVPGLSILDALCFVGFSGTRALLGVDSG